MRLVRLTWLSFLIPLALVAQERPPVPKASVRFDGNTLWLASTNDNGNERIKEFLPEGQKFESWTRLASICQYPNLNDPRAVAENLVRALKQQNPAAQSSIIQNPKTGEVIVDFVTWPADTSFVEFNIFRYARMTGGGLSAQQYALREYKDQSEFLRNLKSLRPRLVEEMAKNGLQQIVP